MFLPYKKVNLYDKIMNMLYVDPSIWAGGLNTGRVYTGSGIIRVGYILGSGKIRAGVFRFYGFRINPTGLERLFQSYFFFHQNKKFSIFIT